MEAVVVIPARMGAQRFPGKPLARETGKYLIQHVWERARLARRAGRVIVATDDVRILDACKGFGAEAAMTPVDCPSGTDRVAKVAATLVCDLIVNVQGDEPEMDPRSIDALVELMERSPAPMGTLVHESEDAALFARPEVVKCAWAEGPRGGRALYFSRAGIPFDRERNGAPARFSQHLGIYAYRRDFLPVVAGLAPSPLERTEKLEQLRVLEAGHEIAVARAPSASHGVDTPEQYADFVVRYRMQHG